MRAGSRPDEKVLASWSTSSAQAVAHHYRDLLGGFILDQTDAGEAAAIIDAGIAVAATQTVMHTLDDRLKLASFALGFAATL